MRDNGNSLQRLRSDAGKRLRLVGPCTSRGRFRVILPLLRFRSRQALGENPTVTLLSGAELTAFTELVRYRARSSHVSERQVFRWLDRFDRGGYVALADQHRKDRGISRFFSNRPFVVAFVTVRYLDGWHVVSIHEALRQAWARLCRDGSPLPNQDTLRRFLKSMIPARAIRRHGNG
jgi:hypothetical protein